MSFAPADRCSHEGCSEPAAWHYAWLGGEKRKACSAHFADVQEKARGLKFDLKFGHIDNPAPYAPA